MRFLSIVKSAESQRAPQALIDAEVVFLAP